ncbi:DUF7260 family protein [Halorussus halophilus]|uniref:DUF7260 family protein n=1 Tax=Halorussus halophilus TaxID=2650975 RepID=UPI00130177D0|nr:hypothetical protein [Halorussus halophilus]
MSVELRTHAAIERATAERERVEEKAAAFRQFDERVQAVSATGGASTGGVSANATVSNAVTPSGAQQSPVGTTLSVGSSSRSSTDATDTVREAFAATILPYAEVETTQNALADELSTDLAAALSPAAGGFAPGLKKQLLARVSERRRECQLLSDAIETERERLEPIAEELDAITSWVAEADETPLLQLGFEELRSRHDHLDAHRETCEELAHERQTAIRGTRNDGLTGIRQRELLDLLYEDFADDNPVLADIARLDDLLAECQRAVRRHLCARV